MTGWVTRLVSAATVWGRRIGIAVATFGIFASFVFLPR
jgi:hypothetical protein